MKMRKYLAWLLVFAFVFSLITGNTAQVMAKSRKATVIKSVSLKIGKKKVTKKTYKMKRGGKKKIKVSVLPQKGKATIKFSTSNKKVVTVNKHGRVTAKKAGTAKVTVTVRVKKAGKSSGTAKKKTWVKIKVTNPSSDTKNDTAEPPATQNPSGKKSIVAYFSCTDNTKTIAEYVAESAGADTYRIEPSVPYTSADLDYNNAGSRTSKEQNDAAARPAIAGRLPSLDNYEVVYLGYPIWWRQAPKIMYTFIESYDLSGKVVVPFCTSGGSGVGTSALNLQAAARGNATWLAGQRFSGSSSKSTVEQWVRGLDLSVGTSTVPTPTAPIQPPIISTPLPTESPGAEQTSSPTETPGSVQTPEVTQPPTETDSPSPTPTNTPDSSGNRKSVVMYFSCTDNTKTIAEYVAESADADIYRIEPAVPYTAADLNYGNADSRTSKEQNDSSARPEIAGKLPDLDQYENVYLGYPIWWGQAPKIMYTFVENCNLSGKTVIPFCTSASSGIGTSATNLQAADTSQAVWLAGRRFSGSSPKSDVEGWISGLG